MRPTCERATFKSIRFILGLTIQCLLPLFRPNNGCRWVRFDLCIECILRCSSCCICRSTGSCRIQAFHKHLSLICAVRAFLADLRSLSQQHLGELGEYGESEDSLFVLLPSPGVVRALAPAVKTSFHCAASALSVVEWSWSGSSAGALSQSSDASRQEIAQQTNKLLAM